MVNLTEGDHDTPPFEVAVYRTDALDSHRGQLPEEEVVRHIAQALDGIGVSYRIYADFGAVPLGNQATGTCQEGEDAYYDWLDYLEMEAPFIAADTNLCLTDQNGGGCAGVDGNAAVAGANQITETRLIQQADEDDQQAGNLYAALHELGHNMGWGHDPHPGDAFNDGFFWNRTPCVGSTTATSNLCGQPIEPEESLNRLNILLYDDCVADEMNVDGLPETIVTNLDAPTNIVAGETVGIEVTVQNRTPVTVTASYPVFVDGDHIGTVSGRIGPFDTVIMTEDWTPAEAGTVTISVADASITRDVEPSGTVSVTGLQTNPGEPAVGEPTQVEVTMRNTTSEATRAEFEVVADRGANRPTEDLGTASRFLGPGETDTDALQWTPSEAGEWTITAGGEAITVSVSEGPTLRVEQVRLANPPARVEKRAFIDVVAVNEGDSFGTRTVSVTVDGTQVGSVSFSLDDGDRRVKTVEWVPVDSGEKTIQAGGATTLVTVEAGSGGGPPPEPPVQPGDPVPAIALGNAVLAIGALVAAPEGALGG